VDRAEHSAIISHTIYRSRSGARPHRRRRAGGLGQPAGARNPVRSDPRGVIQPASGAETQLFVRHLFRSDYFARPTRRRPAPRRSFSPRRRVRHARGGHPSARRRRIDALRHARDRRRRGDAVSLRSPARPWTPTHQGVQNLPRLLSISGRRPREDNEALRTAALAEHARDASSHEGASFALFARTPRDGPGRPVAAGLAAFTGGSPQHPHSPT